VTAVQRRTQAERRAATRDALLEAAVDCLVARGYAGTTTRLIAESAGVSPGALQHHFPSKAALMGEVRRHLTTKAAEQLLPLAALRTSTIRERNEQILDRSWELYKGPLMQAALELLVAARTDPELRSTAAEASRYVASWNEAAGPMMFPELAGRPDLLGYMETVQSTLRGLALGAIGNEIDPDAAWPAVRANLLALYDAYAQQEP
jgi:AcrR family transcriptional regulator